MNAREHFNAAEHLLRKAAEVETREHPRAQLLAKVYAARASAHATLAGVLAANPDLQEYQAAMTRHRAARKPPMLITPDQTAAMQAIVDRLRQTGDVE